MTKHTFNYLVRRVYQLESELNNALAELGDKASEITEEDLYADLCSDGEIEFRYKGCDDALKTAYFLDDMYDLAKEQKK